MRVMKKAAVVAFITFLFFIGMFVPKNWDAIQNRLENCSELVFEQNGLYLLNWIEEEDGCLLSQNDPIIEIPNLNCYVRNIGLELDVEPMPIQLTPQIFWKESDSSDYTEKNSFFAVCDVPDSVYNISLERQIAGLRVDLFENQGQTVRISKIVINPRKLRHVSFDMAAALAVGSFAIYLLFFHKTERYLLHNLRFVLGLVRNDLKTRYAGSVLGVLWAFVQPVLTILVMWFVFQVGFRQSPVNEVEFILWFSSGYIPWMFFNDMAMTSANCLSEYSYLVKKIKFPVDILPVMKLLSGLIVHFVFLIFLNGMFAFYGYFPKPYFLQIGYYLVCMTVLALGLGFLFSALAAFLKDFGQVVGVSLQLLFWMSPIVWAPENLVSRFLPVLKANPLFYIIQGYRESVIYGIGFWTHPVQTAYFWGIALLIFVTGTLLFERLSPHFADVL